MSLFTNILSIIGIITILAIAYFFWRRYLNHKQNEVRRKSKFPPAKYMETVGNLCPDYWVSQPLDEKNHICVNAFNIPVYNSANQSCFDFDANGKIMNQKTFNNITDFPLKKGASNLKSRCDWVANCGINKGMKGIWSGIDTLCPVKE